MSIKREEVEKEKRKKREKIEENEGVVNKTRLPQLVSHNKPLYLPADMVDELHLLTRPYLDFDGREVLNPVPMEVPLNFRQPLSLQQQIKRILRNEFSHHAQLQGFESFEESNDFEVDDSGFDIEPSSKYELMEEDYPIPRSVNEAVDSADLPDVPSESAQSDENDIKKTSDGTSGKSEQELDKPLRK